MHVIYFIDNHFVKVVYVLLIGLALNKGEERKKEKRTIVSNLKKGRGWKYINKKERKEKKREKHGDETGPNGALV